MSATWRLVSGGNIHFSEINGHEYEVYETEPGMQRVRRNGRLIAETFTTEEGKRWAERFDDWLEYVAPTLPARPRGSSEPVMIGDILKDMDIATFRRFPRYPEEFV